VNDIGQRVILHHHHHQYVNQCDCELREEESLMELHLSANEQKKASIVKSNSSLE
jgi:hypothetical protein